MFARAPSAAAIDEGLGTRCKFSTCFAMWAAIAVSLAAFAGSANPARATDETYSADICGGRAAPGEIVHGPVLHIPDASVVCVARGPDPSQWVPVPLNDAAGSRALLMAAAFGENVDCAIGHNGRGECKIGTQLLTARLRLPVYVKAAFTWR
jgi:hypothetical protein